LTGTKPRAFDIERTRVDASLRPQSAWAESAAYATTDRSGRAWSASSRGRASPGDKFLSIEHDMHGNAGVSIFGNGWNGSVSCRVATSASSALLDDLEVRGLPIRRSSCSSVSSAALRGSARAARRSAAIIVNAYSAMLAGGGIRGGTICGASDRTAAYVKDRPVSPEDFGATVLHAVDIPPETRLSPDGFTLPASTGRPVVDLF
jgi:hypothetical protein